MFVLAVPITPSLTDALIVVLRKRLFFPCNLIITLRRLTNCERRGWSIRVEFPDLQGRRRCTRLPVCGSSASGPCASRTVCHHVVQREENSSPHVPFPARLSWAAPPGTNGVRHSGSTCVGIMLHRVASEPQPSRPSVRNPNRWQPDGSQPATNKQRRVSCPKLIFSLNLA